MADEKRFPILFDYHEHKLFPDVPRDVPWSFIEPGRLQALRNHDQTLEELARRGGLAPGEMRVALEGRKLFDKPWDGARMKEDVAWLLAALMQSGPVLHEPRDEDVVPDNVRMRAGYMHGLATKTQDGEDRQWLMKASRSLLAFERHLRTEKK